jgi:hypothetical protein
MAVGESSTKESQAMPLTEKWNGKVWSLETVPTPKESANIKLEGVSCTSEFECTAVGSYSSGTSVLTLAEHWNGTEWKIQTTTNPGSSPHHLYGISCTSASACTAVGYYGNNIPLVERWTTNAWATETAASTSAHLYGSSCSSSTACTAVGQAFPSEGAFQTLAEEWNGKAWTHQLTPNPGSAENKLLGVWCFSSAACSAVGDSLNTLASDQSLAQKWNGTEWLTQVTPNPKGATSSVLQSVVCTAAEECMAVGSFDTETGAPEPLAEIYIDFPV